MSDKNILNGKISVGVPGKQGDLGSSASHTFYGDSSTHVSAGFEILDKNNQKIGNVNKPSGVNVNVNDSVLYKTDKGIVLYNIISQKSPVTFIVEDVDDFVPNISEFNENDDIDDIDITVHINPINNSLPVIRSDHVTLSAPQSQVATGVFSYITQPSLQEAYLSDSINFYIESNNGRKLNGYRIMLEFSTNFTSPGVDGILSNKFQETDQGFSPALGDSSINVYPTSLRGCAADYSNVQGQFPYIKLMNFDNENLENFYLLIKDFKDGENDTGFIKNVNLMYEPLVGRKYECSIIIFVKTANGFYEKRYIGSLNVSQMIMS